METTDFRCVTHIDPTFRGRGAPVRIVARRPGSGERPWQAAAAPVLIARPSDRTIQSGFANTSMLRQLTFAALRHLPASARFALVRELAASLGVQAMIANGASGTLEGNLADFTIFRRYVMDGNWELPTSDALVALLGTAARDDAETSTLPPGNDLFIEAGANIGTIFVRTLSHSAARGIAFEPSPENFARLSANCARNLAPARFELWKVALGDQDGTVRMATSGDNYGDHRIDAAGETCVSMLPLDLAIDPATAPAPGSGRVVLKVDIQGSEPAYLRGAQRWLARADALVIEYTPAVFADAPGDAPGTAFLRALGPHFDEASILQFRDEVATPGFSHGSTLRPVPFGAGFMASAATFVAREHAGNKWIDHCNLVLTKSAHRM